MAALWSALDPQLTPWILEAVSLMGFTSMTPVQASTIPLFMKHKDVVVEAVTGSGKTIAFVIPVIERLVRREEEFSPSSIGVLIISPTRELASQIYQVVLSFLSLQTEEAHRHISAQLIVGGTTTPSQDLANFHRDSPTIVIATPGRLNALLSHKSVHVKDLEVLVMDEADRLLDMGFHQVLTSILKILPKQRRTGLFSATMTDAVGYLIRTGLRNPVRVIVKVNSINKTKSTEQRVPASLRVSGIVVHPSEKIVQMVRLLCNSLDENLTKSIVYFSTCACVDYFSSLLSSLPLLRKFALIPLHGKQTSSMRSRNLKKFIALSSSAPAVLFTTDLAARGLDVPDVDLVIQLDPPQDPKSFAHRCGRAGRAGRVGKAVVLLNRGREEEYVEFLQIRRTPVEISPRLGVNGQVLAETDNIDDEVEAVRNKLKMFIRKDRALYEKVFIIDRHLCLIIEGMKAFVSYIKAYSKHQASFIFRIQDLDFTGLASEFALLRLPSMPELKNRIVEYDNEVVNMIAYAFSDKNRERARQKELAEPKPVKIVEPKKKTKNVAWSEKLAARDQKEERRNKRFRKKRALERERKKMDQSSTGDPIQS
ncbi:ATP-dependent rRNA helicase spb4 [Neolecta irregularis DAH-3]|uniref:ATP-dependent RNA helicase n=1 Tax=Neolecta irregularis (strain DAH-3) TaxID=1198029 RepID=A0A1U7LMT5_NEOID|nr:ATP-dependent rRNA helicase spb4 [Neolecta irregularis DAH-3]|eukprot:OLL23980.1 ATP-dependent rRNA helicase spb4 [Neolecta irregularis DAH-3]